MPGNNIVLSVGVRLWLAGCLVCWPTLTILDMCFTIVTASPDKKQKFSLPNYIRGEQSPGCRPLRSVLWGLLPRPPDILWLDRPALWIQVDLHHGSLHLRHRRAHVLAIGGKALIWWLRWVREHPYSELDALKWLTFGSSMFIVGSGQVFTGDAEPLPN